MAAHAGQTSQVSSESRPLAGEPVDTGMMPANNIWWSDGNPAFIGVAEPGYARDPARSGSAERAT